MLEIVVFILFLGSVYSIVIGGNIYQRWKEKRQEYTIGKIADEAYGQRVETLFPKLGDPWEIEPGAASRELYIWKFPPGRALPTARGLFTVTVIANAGLVTAVSWNRRR